MPLAIIRELVENCVLQHIDPDQWEKEKMIESQERQALDVVIEAYKAVGA
jgi:hypothetical protein